MENSIFSTCPSISETGAMSGRALTTRDIYVGMTFWYDVVLWMDYLEISTAKLKRLSSSIKQVVASMYTLLWFSKHAFELSPILADSRKQICMCQNDPQWWSALRSHLVEAYTINTPTIPAVIPTFGWGCVTIITYDSTTDVGSFAIIRWFSGGHDAPLLIRVPTLHVDLMIAQLRWISSPWNVRPSFLPSVFQGSSLAIQFVEKWETHNGLLSSFLAGCVCKKSFCIEQMH